MVQKDKFIVCKDSQQHHQLVCSGRRHIFDERRNIEHDGEHIVRVDIVAVIERVYCDCGYALK